MTLATIHKTHRLTYIQQPKHYKMKISLSLIIGTITLLASNLFAQQGDNHIVLSHKITTETKDISGFDKIDVSEDFMVYIRVDNGPEKVVIESNENLHDLIQVEKKGRTLKIDTKPYSTYAGVGKKQGGSERLVAYITAKSLTEIKGDEDVVIELENKLVTNNLVINLDEDSTLEGHIEVQSLVVDLDGDSTLDIKGSAGKMDAVLNEDSMIDGFDFMVGDLSIKLMDDSESKLTINGTIDLRAKGDSSFYYKGDATFIKKHLTGESEVEAW